MKILIVDDEGANVKLLEKILSKRGYETLKAYDGETALAIVEKHDVDLILLDVLMPGISGFEVARRVKAIKQIPIIMISVLTEREKIIEGLKSGANEFVSKPYLTEEIVLRIENIFKLKRYRDLEDEKDYAESIIGTIREPLLVLDKDLRVVSASRYFYDTFKVEKKDTEGNLIYNLGNGQWNIPALRTLLTDILPGKNSFEDYEIEHEFSTIGKKNMILNARELKRADGKSQLILLAIEDVTEKRKAEKIIVTAKKVAEAEKILVLNEQLTAANQKLRDNQAQLLQSQKMESIGTLAGGIAHDFNNLLTVIKGNVYIAQKKMGKESSAADALEHVSIAADRAAELTKQMLLFSRQQPMIVTNLNINDIVENTFKMLSRLIGEDIKVEKKLQAGLWNIKADKTKIEQILLNLAVNARDAMPNGGGLKVETENVVLKESSLSDIPEAYPGKFVKLSVQDNGIGMSKDIIQHMFEPYFTTKGAGKGTGLGLSVVYGIVKQHKGCINIYSESGKGSIFNIYLPATSEAKTVLKDKNIEVKDLKGNGERILIVEDEPGIKELLQLLLTDNGYTVFSSGSASEALEIFNREKHNFDIVLSDIVLPDRNGLQLVKELLSAKPGLKVIFSSGYMDDKSQFEVVQGSGYVFIQKPYESNTLFVAIKRLLTKN